MPENSVAAQSSLFWSSSIFELKVSFSALRSSNFTLSTENSLSSWFLDFCRRSVMGKSVLSVGAFSFDRSDTVSSSPYSHTIFSSAIPCFFPWLSSL